MLTPEEASDVAAAHALSPADAVALRILADTVAQANEIAAKFQTGSDRDVVRQLFDPPKNPGTGIFAPPNPKGPAA